MVVKVSKPEINVREKISELDKPSGVAGEAMLRAETPQEQFNLIGAGRRNLLYNGNMRIAQRGVSHSGIGGDGYYSLDRWAYEEGNATPEFDITQENDAPDGFSKSLKFAVAVPDTSLAGSTYIQVTQILEGVDLQSLAKGSSAAQPLTLSFWVKSNVTGTYATLLWDSPNARQNSASYTVDQSGVWEYKTITFAGDTQGSIDDDNTEGLSLKFVLGIGIDYTGGVEGPTSHSTTDNYAANHAVNVAASTSNYWQITGVQLELGKIATPFEHRSYGEELALCQRYYQKVPSINSSGYIYDHCVFHWGTDFFASHTFMQPMRANPSITITTTGTYYEGGSSYSHGSITVRQPTPDSLNFHAATNGGTSGYAGAVYFRYTADAEL